MQVYLYHLPFPPHQILTSLALSPPISGVSNIWPTGHIQPAKPRDLVMGGSAHGHAHAQAQPVPIPKMQLLLLALSVMWVKFPANCKLHWGQASSNYAYTSAPPAHVRLELGCSKSL